MAYAYSLVGPAAFGSNGDSLFPTFKRLAQNVHDHFIPHERNNYHPHILGHRFLGLFALMMVALKLSLIAGVAFSPASSVIASPINTTNVISLSNSSRAASGLPALTSNGLLARAAQAKADDMLARGYFAHNSPDGKTPWTFIKAAGYSYISAGENLAVDFTQAENVETAWMNSPGHRANILNKNYEEIGVGIATGQWQGHETTFVVQMFGTPVAQNVAITNIPTVVQPAVPTAHAAVAAAPVKAEAIAQSSPASPAQTKSPAPTAPVAIVSPTLETALANLEPAKVNDVQTSISGSNLNISVTTNGTTDQVIASYNDKGIMLYPRGPESWQGSIPLTSLPSGTSLAVLATDIAGNSDQKPVASFTGGQADSYGASTQGQVQGANISLFGVTFDRHAFEQKFFLLAITGLLAALIVAIAIKRHIQHLSLIANGSFVVILVTLLWISG